MGDDFELHVITEDGTEQIPARGDDQFKPHNLGLPRLFRQDKSISSDKLISSWQNTNQVIVMMMNDAKEKEAAGGMKLSEIEVTLSVSGEGNIGFVSGKAEAGIVLKFTRS